MACTVANTGHRRGKEVVQLYVDDPEATVARPPRELKGFVKVDLEPGTTERVEFRLTARDLSYWSTTEQRWLVEAGVFEISIGASSRDLRLAATIDMAAPRVRTRLDSMASLKEWLADPDAAAALRMAIGVGPDGRSLGILGDDEVMRVIGKFPISSLATFPGTGIDHTIVTDLASRFC